MERRFEVRKQAILNEAKIKPAVSKEMLERLEQFTDPFIKCLKRPEPKEYAQIYIGGLLSDLQRKNVESIAYRYDLERQNLQRFVGWAPWDHSPLLEELAKQVGVNIGEDDAVIVFDPSGFKKCGHDSVGVQRQWLGRLGKIDNGQVGIYMSYASRIEHALVDVRLYLPEDWAKDKARRKKCGIPNSVRFQTRLDLALEMLQTNGQYLPHQWIAGDDEMGRSSYFRRRLDALGEWYLLDIPSNTNIRDIALPAPPYTGHGRPSKQPFQRVDVWRDSLPADAWTCVDVRDGDKGPLKLEIATTRVVARTERGRGDAGEELLVVTRCLDENDKLKYDYHLCNAPSDTPLTTFSRVVKAEHRVEDSLKRSKSEAGLADYEVRTWSGWYHHQTLSLIATWFLIQETRRGEKIYSSNHGSSDPVIISDVVASSLRSKTCRLADTFCATKKRSKRVGSFSLLQAT